jgi:alkylhydroperoxidase family enzyme
VPRIEPVPPTPGGNAVVNSLLARVMGRRPDILKAFGRLDNTIRFKGLLPVELKESVRRATAGEIGCVYCQSLGAVPNELERRESLAVAFAQAIAQGPSEISDGEFAVLREDFTEDEIVELVAFICFVAIAGQMFGAVMGLEAATAEEAGEYQQVLAGRV